MDEALRRYLQTRISLGDPELFLSDLDRRRARSLVRRIATRGTPGRADARPPSRSPGGRGAGSARGRDATGSGGPAPKHDRLSREASAEEVLALEDMEALRTVAEACVRCPLHEDRQQVVFGEGDIRARVVCVGEAPGANEDRTGRPFVGRAGKLMDRLLLSVGFRREEVYICNVLKCRPPGNRNPRKEEIEQCSPYLLRQIQLVDPDVIIAFGTFATQTLLEVRSSLGRLRGRVHRFRGYPLVATYHPAALLRNPNWTRPSWEDLQRVRRLLDGAGDAPSENGA